MNISRVQLASWRRPGSWIRSHSSRLLAGFGLAAAALQESVAAQKDARQAEGRDSGERERRDGNDERENRQNNDQGAARVEQEKTRASETRAASQEPDDKSARQDRKEDRASDNDVEKEAREDDGRSVTWQQEAESDSTGDGDGSGGNRRSQVFEQRIRDDEPTEVLGPVPPPQVASSNPNVFLDTGPDFAGTFDAELLVQGGSDVIAAVSSTGGFSFARSGDVIAISGPDGARVISAGDSGITPAPDRDEPLDDGGNNDVRFAS